MTVDRLSNQAGIVAQPARRAARKPLWQHSMQTGLMKQMRPAYDVHGFRSTFTDWAAEVGYPHDLGQRPLAHNVGNKGCECISTFEACRATAAHDDSLGRV